MSTSPVKSHWKFFDILYIIACPTSCPPLRGCISIMFAGLGACLTLTSLAAATSISQKPLNDQDQPPNFIQSSIFGRSSLDTNTLNDPVILAPTFEYKSSESLFGGLGTFAHLDFVDCTKQENSATFDIGIVGHPFDLGVSYRPGARFGPNGARQGARRLSQIGGWE